GGPARGRGRKAPGKAAAAGSRQGKQGEQGKGQSRGRPGLTVAKKATGENKARPLPSRDEILAFIAEHPGKAGKREIARAFGISGSNKIALKATLQDLAGDGLVERRRKKLKRPADLPSVSVLVVTGRDADGEL